MKRKHALILGLYALFCIGIVSAAWAWAHTSAPPLWLQITVLILILFIVQFSCLMVKKLLRH